MKKSVMYYFSGILLCFLFLQLHLYSQDSSSDTLVAVPVPTPISETNLIHFGDLIDIDVLGSAEFDWRGTISTDGFLEGFGYSSEPINGLCKSEDQLAQVVKEYYRKFLREPEIVVKILDRSNRPVSILSGAIRTPQRFLIKRSIFLNELLIISGGLTEKASGEIQIFRPRDLNCLAAIGQLTASLRQNTETRERFIAASEDNGSQFINIKISDLLSGKDHSNPQILSGDIVTVFEFQPIYVIGGVENPTQIASRSQMTLTRAIATAGGLSKDSDPARITVYRREGNETKIINANLARIKDGQEVDVLLGVFDIVEVGQSGKEARKTPPILENMDINSGDKLKLPLRIID